MTPTPAAPPTETGRAEGPTTTEAAKTRQVYYVAANEPGASDDNNSLYPTHQGGQDGPWLTIQHDVQQIKNLGARDENSNDFASLDFPGLPVGLRTLVVPMFDIR
jgi:hypothetical protein